MNPEVSRRTSEGPGHVSAPKQRVSTRQVAVFRPLSARSAAQGSGPPAFVKKNSPPRQCPAQRGALMPMPRAVLHCAHGTRGLRLNAFCVPGRRPARRSSEVSPGCAGGPALHHQVGGPLPPHSSRTQTSGCWALGVSPPRGRPPLRARGIACWRPRPKVFCEP